MLHRMTGSIALCAALGFAPAAHAAGTRTHVSNAGSDANTAFSCDSAHPCRTFAAALTVTTPGGEILAIDSSGYGKVVIDRSVSIIAAPGVFAGIGVGAGGNATGIEIATAGVNVVLRGLAITGQGGTYGVDMTNGTALIMEDCTVSGFAGAGVRLFAAAKVRLANLGSHANSHGLLVGGNTSATVTGSRFFANSIAGVNVAAASGESTNASVADSVASGGTYGFTAYAAAGGTARLYVTQSTASGNSYGFLSSSGGGTALVSAGRCLVSENGTGLRASVGATLHASGNVVSGNNWGMAQQTTGVLGSTGDNLVYGNTSPVSGAITLLTTM